MGDDAPNPSFTHDERDPIAWIARIDRHDCRACLRYREDGYLSDMDAGFYSADYLRAWIRSAQLRAYLRRELGEDWWRNAETGDRLRALFFEGTRPSSEEIAGRLGFDPLDTTSLLHELGAA